MSDEVRNWVAAIIVSYTIAAIIIGLLPSRYFLPKDVEGVNRLMCLVAWPCIIVLVVLGLIAVATMWAITPDEDKPKSQT